MALPADLAEAIAALHLLGDDDLKRAAGQRLGADAASEIEELHHKRQREGLSATEADTLAALLRASTRVMLVRSRAAAILTQRGHDVSALLGDDEP